MDKTIVLMDKKNVIVTVSDILNGSKATFPLIRWNESKIFLNGKRVLKSKLIAILKNNYQPSTMLTVWRTKRSAPLSGGDYRYFRRRLKYITVRIIAHL
jgi:hypothetical protein